MENLKYARVRKSLPLFERDLHDLALMRGSEAHRAALAHLVDAELTSESSEATLLHSVMEAGIKAVQQQVEDQGYAQIAAEMDEASQRTVARRRRPSWTDE